MRRGYRGLTWRMLTALALVALLLLYATALFWWRRGDRLRDGLTGLATRDHLMSIITRCATQAAWRPDYRYAVLVLEIDRENRLRETVGRFGVEDAIADTAERLRLCARGGDVVARIAERRFGVLLDDVADAEGARMAAGRMMAALEEASILSGRRVRTTPAAGLTISGEWTLAPEEMLARSEAVLGEKTLLPPRH